MLIVDRQALAAALHLVSPLAPARAAQPALLHALLAFDGSHLTLTTTNIESRIRTQVVADGTAKAFETATVDVHRLQAIADRGAGDRLTLESARGWLAVCVGGTRAKLPTLPAGEFPVGPELGPGAAATVTAETFAAALRAALTTAESDARNRPHLAGVRLEVTATELTCVGTNGHHLAARVGPVLTASGTPFATTIPHRGADVLAEALAAADVTTAVALRFDTHGRLAASWDAQEWSTVTIDAAFPDWRQVLPAATGAPVRIVAGSLLGALERVRTMREEKVELAVAGAALTLTMEGPEGQAEEALPVEGTVGKTRTVGFSPSYLRDGFKLFPDTATVECTIEATEPLILRSAGAPGLVYLLQRRT